MLEDLKNLNNSGEKEDIVFFLLSIIGNRQLAEEDIINLCSHAPGQYQLDVKFLLAYSTIFNLIERTEKIALASDVSAFIGNSDGLNTFIVERTLSKLFDANVFNADMFEYNELNKRFAFKKEHLSLSYSAIRNTLINQGFFDIERDDVKTNLYISKRYERIVASFNRDKRRIFGIEQLKKQLEMNSAAGEKAERFVLEYERKRLETSLFVEKIRIISDIDVCAGYDIVSFNTTDSEDYDRFIEVKAIAKSRTFYWSINELNTARLKGKQYFLYLVDLQKVYDEGYAPDIVIDPANTLLSSEEWLIESQSFRISHI